MLNAAHRCYRHHKIMVSCADCMAALHAKLHQH